MAKGRQQGSTYVAAAGVPIQWTADAARDRLSSTVFLAGLFHGIVILGVTFSGDAPPPDPTTMTSLEVVLVTNQYEDRLPPEEAELLAQQNLDGAGNTEDPMQLKTALAQNEEAPLLGPEQTGVSDPQVMGTEQPAHQAVLTATAIDGNLKIEDEAGETEQLVSPEQRSLPGTASAVEIVIQPDDETLVTDARPRELIISANTRESRIATYLSTWKRKVERIGTLNYPLEARHAGTQQYPTLEVAIRSDGGLEEVVVRNSSGLRRLDQAAMNILRSAAPFEPFPDFLRSDYDVLRFAYEWRFMDGQSDTRITAVEGS